MMFDRMAFGKPTIDVNAYQSPFDPSAGQKMRDFMARKGNASGQMTKELFTEYFNEQMTARRAGGGISGEGGPAAFNGPRPGFGAGAPGPAGDRGAREARQNLILTAPLREELALGKDQIAKLDQLEKETRKKMMDILKPDQKKKLEEMLDRGGRTGPMDSPSRTQRRRPPSDETSPRPGGENPPDDR